MTLSTDVSEEGLKRFGSCIYKLTLQPIILPIVLNFHICYGSQEICGNITIQQILILKTKVI